MTSFTIVFAMIPLSLKLTSGAEARSPVAGVLMGGVLSSMLLTLVVVPVVYTLLEDLANRVRIVLRLPNRLAGGAEPAPSDSPSHPGMPAPVAEDDE